MEAVSKHPVAIGINANKVFQLYASGIISAKDCGPAPHTRIRRLWPSTTPSSSPGGASRWSRGGT